MPISRFAPLTALVLIACDSPVAPAARQLRIPEYRADVGVERTKTNVVFDTDASAENTCNGDHVTLEGKGHQVFTLIDTGDSIFITAHVNFADLKGYGVPSGARYHVNNSQTERVVVTQGSEFTFEDAVWVNNEVVSEGSEPNLMLHFTEIVSIADNEVTVTIVKYSLECRG